MSPPKLRPIDVRYVFGLYQLGHTQKAIASEFNVAEATVQSVLKRRNQVQIYIEPELMVFPTKPLSNGYDAGHRRVRKVKGKPNLCEDCGRTDSNIRYEWASLSMNYGNPEDYRRLCQSCHIRMDESSNKGETHPSSKLTDGDVREIRRRYVKGEHGPNSTPNLAKEFGVHQRKIWEIINGKAWKHVQ